MLTDRFYTVVSHMDAFDPLGQISIFSKQSRKILLTYLSLSPRPGYRPSIDERPSESPYPGLFASGWFQVMPILSVSTRRSRHPVFLGLPLLPFDPLGVPRQCLSLGTGAISGSISFFSFHVLICCPTG